MNTASMVGFGAVIAALPAFAGIRDALVAIPGGPLVLVAVATNVIAGITGSASGGLIIALEAMGDTYVRVAAAAGIDPALMHRVVAIGCGGLSGLPHNGAVVTLLSVSGATHRGSYRDIAIVMAKTYGIRVAYSPADISKADECAAMVAQAQSELSRKLDCTLVSWR